MGDKSWVEEEACAKVLSKKKSIYRWGRRVRTSFLACQIKEFLTKKSTAVEVEKA